MSEKSTLERAKQKLRAGDSASTAAGEFVRQEMDHIREGKHGARSPEQAIAIGLAKARRAGIALPAPKSGPAKGKRQPKKRTHPPSRKRSRAMLKALEREPHTAASHEALAKHAHKAATRRTAAERSAAAKRGARTRAG